MLRFLPMRLATHHRHVITKYSRHRLPLCHSCPPHYLLGACRAFRLPLIAVQLIKSVVSVPCPLMKAMQTEKEKVYHKAVNVGFTVACFTKVQVPYAHRTYKDLLGLRVITTYFCVA